jgi:RimJ/RimL family protein N-acetyltransferase
MIQTEILGGRKISLRPLSLDLSEPISAPANEPTISLYLRDVFPYPYTAKDAEGYIRFAADNPLLHAWAIFEHEKIGGMISLTFQEDIYRHSAEIGFWLGKDFQGRGIMTEAVRLACDHAFREFSVIRIFAAVFEPNGASRKVLLKNGFEVEGIRKKSVIKNKVLLNDYFMAKLKES